MYGEVESSMQRCVTRMPDGCIWTARCGLTARSHHSSHITLKVNYGKKSSNNTWYSSFFFNSTTYMEQWEHNFYYLLLIQKIHLTRSDQVIQFRLWPITNWTFNALMSKLYILLESSKDADSLHYHLHKNTTR